jgi:hypothetical protein
MLRPPTSDGRGESDVHDLPDERPTPVPEPAEGTPDWRLPGADQDGPTGDLPQRLGERIENGSSSAIATGEPDILPDVELPDTTM